MPISGVAPRAYLMNYRVFYPSKSPEDFQNGNAYTVELVKAIEDAVKDGADVISNSWGSSYQNTLAWPDPMIQAADDAVDAGVVMVFANGNAGPDTATGLPGDLAEGDRRRRGDEGHDDRPGLHHVTARARAGEPVGLPVRRRGLRAADDHDGRAGALVPAETVSTAPTNKTLGCSLAGDASPFPAGSLTGKIALIERGVCNFSEKVFNAQRGGAIAAFVYNCAAGGDTLDDDGHRRPWGGRDDPVVVPAPHRRAEHDRVRERPPGRGAGEVRLFAARGARTPAT